MSESFHKQLIEQRRHLHQYPEVGWTAIPFHEIKKAIRFSLPGLISSFKGDERNVLLTLSRMWLTLVTEEITTKDVAAKWVILKLPERFPPPANNGKGSLFGKFV